MCRVYNQIGCLTAIKLHLHKHNIEYKSLNDLINFLDSYSATRQQIISTHRPVIEQEKNTLIDKIALLEYSIKTQKREIQLQLLSELKKLKDQLNSSSSIHSNIIAHLINYIKKNRIKLNLWHKKHTFSFNVAHSLEQLINDYGQLNNRLNYITSNFDKAVIEKCDQYLQNLDRNKVVIDQINNFIYGALGEEKVVKELEKLSDEYILINDFRCEFDRAIYNRQENDYIKSIQIDHILLSPAGVFLIETKNWSQHSTNNPNLYSPVKQIKRANLALYKILNRQFFNTNIIFTKHYWGSRKIPVKNLIVFTNYKPVEEFQYVKILTLNDLLGYIKYFKPYFSSLEVQSMSDYLLKI